MPDDELEISKTAIWVAAARAIGAREPDPAARNPDHLAERLLGDPSQLSLHHPVVAALLKSYEVALQDLEVADLVRAMTERTRFIDEALERAVSNGITQCLILGAGFDSHAYRFRQLLAHVRIYEVDRPQTSTFKRCRVDAALDGAPANLTYVAADLEREDLAHALARHGYDLSRPTFVIMEGVSMYVQEAPLRATFRFFGKHAPGSSIVFDFATRAMIDGLRALEIEKIPPYARATVERFLDLIRGEPWVFGIPLGSEKEFLAGLGLQLRSILTIGSEESVRRYLTRTDGSIVGAEAHARAEALGRSMRERITATLDPARRDQVEAAMREQARQNAYQIAEASAQVPGVWAAGRAGGLDNAFIMGSGG
ncbi:MAG TPA: SAM-dependent methyltransferase [Steroidobacteraceae bacterium]|jgi:methyltransferase (TIGR00027 family)|nr:SAM-dependent methyltransferase [Steroidobacteraceae bacterium]